LRSREEDIILLENYLKGNLSERQMAEVASRIEHEKDLSLDLQDLKTLSAGIRLSELKGKMDLLKSVEANRDVKVKKNQKGYLTGFILIFLLLVGYLIYSYFINDNMQSEANQQFYAGNFDEDLILHKTYRSSNENNSLTPIEKRGYDLYSLQLFEEAIPELEKLWNEKSDTLALFYLGVSYKAIGNEEKCNEIFNMYELNKYELLYSKLIK
jgi:hypothetical protein